MNKWILMIIICVSASCSQRQAADLAVYNARVYTVDSVFAVAESFAIKNGKIIAVGNEQDILSRYHAKEQLDAGGKFIYPGFIDAHCHFYHYGLSLQSADLRGTQSFEEVIEALLKHVNDHPSAWILGRGWDQNDWLVKNFPDKQRLDELFPDKPVMLTRIDGHAALVNSVALKLAGIGASTKVEGGEIIRHEGEPTGILIDNAMELVTKLIPAHSRGDKIRALQTAEGNCFAAGLTTVADAGIDRDVIQMMDSLQKSGSMKMKVYAMLSANQENFEQFMYHGPYMTDRLNVRSVKLYADGALGSRGACLLQPYADDPENYGLLVETEAKLNEICKSALKHGYQVNVHAIGDSGVRTVLKVFRSALKGKNDLRWRIEHAQVVSTDDFGLFGQYSVIPSVQPTHATSDMPWATDRLGPERVMNAYAYKRLLQENGWIAFGTDFPIEKIDPLHTFFSAVFRKDASFQPVYGWQTGNAVSREEAIKAMTIWAAKACFEEKFKGSLEVGKAADFVVLDRDIMTGTEEDILRTCVLRTFVNGEKVFERQGNE